MKHEVRGSLLAACVSVPIYLLLALALGTARKGYIGSGGQGFDPAHVPITSAAACAISLVFALMLLFGRRRWPSSVGSAAAVGALANVGFVIGVSELQLEAPLWHDWKDLSWEPPFRWWTFAVLVIGGAIAGAVLFSAMRDRRRMLFIPALALALSAVTVVFAAISTRRPEPDDFRVFFERYPLRDGTEVAVGPLGFQLRDGALLVRRPDGSIRDENEFRHPSPVAVERDPVTGIVAAVPASNVGNIASPILSGRGDREYSELAIADFPGRFGAPRWWMWGAIVGLVLGCAALGLAAFILRRTDTFLANAIDAEHADGWVTMPERPPLFVESIKAQPPGPVLVQLRRETVPGYRDSAAAAVERVTLGSREAWRAHASSHAQAWACIAVGAAWMTAAPLLVAWYHGLLG